MQGFLFAGVLVVRTTKTLANKQLVQSSARYARAPCTRSLLNYL